MNSLVSTSFFLKWKTRLIRSWDKQACSIWQTPDALPTLVKKCIFSKSLTAFWKQFLLKPSVESCYIGDRRKIGLNTVRMG